MDLKVFKDTFISAGRRWEGRCEIPVDTEILIPDYLPPVFKVVKCIFYLVVLQKSTAGNRLRLEGYLRCMVLYQSEEQGLCQIEQKVPYEKTMELPEGDFSQSRVITSGSVEYSNCRAVNQRRMEVRGAYILQAEMRASAECELVSSLAGAGIEQQPCRFDLVRCVCNLDKLMTNEEIVHLPEDVGAVIEISGYGKVEECRLLGEKAVVKGQSEIQIAYTRKGSEVIENEPVTVPFNQILDLEKTGENTLCSAVVETVGCSLNSESEEESITVTSLLRLALYEKQESAAVEDAFSTRCESQTEYETLVCQELADKIDAVISCSGKITLPEPQASYIGCFALAAAPQMRAEENGTAAEGSVSLNLIYKNTLGEYMCIEQEIPYRLPQAYPGEPEQYLFDGSVQLCEIQCRQIGAEVQAEAQLQASGVLLAARQHRLLSQFSCGENWQEGDNIALRIYFAHAGEAVFDIAKRYHACAAALRQCNRLETPFLESDQHILIPRAN